MNVVSIVETVIKNHPAIDFELTHKTFTEHWYRCPCGYSTKHYKSRKSAHRAFRSHIVDEVNETLFEENFLTGAPKGAQGLSLATATR